MHEAIDYLKKRVETLAKDTDAVLDEVSRQVERETKALEAMEYGRTFDEESALLQERIVEALQDALEALEKAQEGAQDAGRAFRGLRERGAGD